MEFGKGSELERDIKVVKVAKVRKSGREELMAEGQKTRTEAKGKREAAREKTEHVGRVAKQDTLQRGVERAARKTCAPLMKMRLKTLKKHLTTMKSCKRGACWKKVKMSSGKRCSADVTNTRC